MVMKQNTGRHCHQVSWLLQYSRTAWRKLTNSGARSKRNSILVTQCYPVARRTRGSCLRCTHPAFDNRRAESDNWRSQIKIDECKTRTEAKKSRAVGRGRRARRDRGMLSRWGPWKAFVLWTRGVSKAALGSCFKATTLNQSFMACPNRLTHTVKGIHTIGDTLYSLRPAVIFMCVCVCVFTSYMCVCV